MIVAEQQDVIAFLSEPSNWSGKVDSVDKIETHGSMVFLGGDRALKMKRAVKYDYMDFSSLQRRRQCCEAELVINRRTAPMLYRRVRRVTREADGRLTLDGAGDVVEWLVEMTRFDQDLLFDRLARVGKLTVPLIERLADTIAAFHREAEVDKSVGGASAFSTLVSGNAHDLAPHLGKLTNGNLVATIVEKQRAAIQLHHDRLDACRDAGWVRHCHGDLHLGNICLIDNQPVLFDAIEFNDSLAVVNVLYDVSFAIMDLAYRDLAEFANLLMSRYFAHVPDLGCLALMPLFLSCRAMVRAKVLAELASIGKATADDPLLAAAGYIRLAERYLAPSAPRLIALGGVSGTGKSTVARALAPEVDNPPGALVLRSDVQRKIMLGQSPLTRLGVKDYAPEVSAKVYAELAARAAQAVAAGRSVIVDAVHARPEERSALAAMAEGLGVRFDGFWLTAPRQTLVDRIGGRRDDVSDADVGVLEEQLKSDFDGSEWQAIDASTTTTNIVGKMLSLMRR